MYYIIFVNLFCILYFRYKLKVRVIDDTDSTTFVLFDRDATTLINKSFAELFENRDRVKFPKMHMSIDAYKKRLVYKFIFLFLYF